MKQGSKQASFGVWMNFAASPTFALERLLVAAAITLPLIGYCLYTRHAAWVPLSLFVGVWPLPFRCRVPRR